MNVLRKGSRGSEIIPIDSLMLQDRKIFLGGTIDVEHANEIAKEIMVLNMESREESIDVVFSSPQIGMAAGLILCDVLRSQGAPIRLYGIGLVSGMAAILFVGGEHGRYMTPHARLQLKLPAPQEVKVIGFDAVSDAHRDKSLRDMIVSSLMEDYAEKNAKGAEFSENNSSGYDAKYCKQHGLCDRIVRFDSLMNPVTKIQEIPEDDGYQDEADEFDTDFWNCA